MRTSLSLFKDMSEIENLPSGIQILRGFKLDDGLPVRPARFEKLVERLNECADNHSKAAKCHRCPYLAECLSRFDTICDKVAMY